MHQVSRAALLPGLRIGQKMHRNVSSTTLPNRYSTSAPRDTGCQKHGPPFSQYFCPSALVRDHHTQRIEHVSPMVSFGRVLSRQGSAQSALSSFHGSSESLASVVRSVDFCSAIANYSFRHLIACAACLTTLTLSSKVKRKFDGRVAFLQPGGGGHGLRGDRGSLGTVQIPRGNFRERSNRPDVSLLPSSVPASRNYCATT